MEPILKLTDVNKSFGGVVVAEHVDLELYPGQIHGLIGSNGAGKSSMLKAISGMVEHTGTIEWCGENITHYSSVAIAKRGVMHVPEGRQVFPGLTVFENLEAGCVNWRGFLGRGDYSNELEYVYSMFPRLKERANQLAWSLSGGEQQMLAIGRALMGRPKILLLDEPSMGLAPLVVDEMFEKIIEINNSGLPILMVEQNARKALKVSDYAYIISQGEIVLEGLSKKLIHDERVVSTYFGKYWKTGKQK